MASKILHIGHAGQSISFCKESDKFYCFRSQALSFAVPKENLTVGLAWKKNARNYQIEGKEDLHLLGCSRDVYVISSPIDAERVDYFYYSPQDGIIGIRIEYIKQTKSRFFFSESSHGFPFSGPGTVSETLNEKPAH